MKMLRSYLSVSAIIGQLPSQIINGQLIDAVPVMADLNFIVNQVNSNVPPLIPVVTQSIIFVPTASVGGTGNAITLSPTPSLGAYVAGASYRFPAGAVNTSSVQVNVSGLGNQAIVNGGSGAALTGGELQAGGIYDICYNGAAFELVNASQGSGLISYTPVLSFGGASVGLTYGNQLGQYQKIGPLVFVYVFIALTNKGSSVGLAQVTLPFTVNASWLTGGIAYSGTVAPSNILYGANSNLVADPVTGAASTAFQIVGNNVSALNLTNTGFSNTSIIAFSLWYPT